MNLVIETKPIKNLTFQELEPGNLFSTPEQGGLYMKLEKNNDNPHYNTVVIRKADKLYTRDSCLTNWGALAPVLLVTDLRVTVEK